MPSVILFLNSVLNCYNANTTVEEDRQELIDVRPGREITPADFPFEGVTLDLVNFDPSGESHL